MLRTTSILAALVALVTLMGAPTSGSAALPPAQYIAVDLSAGPSAQAYPVLEYDAEPLDLHTNPAWKTTHLLLRRVQKTTFTMGSPADEVGRSDRIDETQHEVTLTKDYFVGVFMVTQRQWELVMDENASIFTGDATAMDSVGWDQARGGRWPFGDPAPESFSGRLSARTGRVFDLPTEAQWEHACRAGTTTALHSGANLTEIDRDPAVDPLAWYGGTSNSRAEEVGLKLPNPLGLYDLYGNLQEWCLDYIDDYAGDATDPVGPYLGTHRVLRGSTWGFAGSSAADSRSAARSADFPHIGISQYGFRVTLQDREPFTIEPETGFLLIKKAKLTEPGGKKAPGLKLKGTLDTGPSDVDLTRDATLRLNDRTLQLPGGLAEKGRDLVFDDGTVRLALRPLVAGSSRHALTLDIADDLSSSVFADAPLTLEIANGEVEATTTVQLTKGVYKAKDAEDVDGPDLALVSLKGKVKGAGRDAIKLVATFSTERGAGDAPSDLAVELDGFASVGATGRAFKRKRSKDSFKGRGPGLRKAVVDHARGRITLDVRDLDLSNVPEGASTFAITIFRNGEALRTEVRVTRKKKNLRY